MMVIVGYMLYIDHREHINQALPWLILLLCPAMHLFMHHGHDSHHPHERDKDKSQNKEDE
ncbi:MAG: hypothetical protein CMF48_03365 [Legionellales bacterium]|nr:hypothetical protein [Legionellales bacterium]